ncbi:MAG TPA: glutathione S-transferase family protein [Kofleriaceae bacterium]
MKLYYSHVSANSRRVRVVAAALKLELDIVPIDLANPGERTQLLAINPNNKVPVLVDGDFVLWESNAINSYLCSKVADQTLLPSAPREHAEVVRWLYWNATHFAQAVSGLNFEHFVKGLMKLGGPDDKAVAHHERLFHQFAKVADAHLAKHAWLANDRLSLADYSLVSTLMSAHTAKLPLDAYQQITALVARVHDRPEWAAAAK